MASVSGPEYHRVRANMELDRAAQAADTATAALHRQLAELHLDRLAALAEPAPEGQMAARPQ